MRSLRTSNNSSTSSKDRPLSSGRKKMQKRKATPATPPKMYATLAPRATLGGFWIYLIGSEHNSQESSLTESQTSPKTRTRHLRSCRRR